MKIKNIVIGTILTIMLVCGVAAAFPAVSTAIAVSSETSKMIREEIYVKTQNMEYLNEEGQKIQVAISSNSDDSRMMIYSNLYGDRQYALVYQDDEGNYRIKDSTLSDTDAINIAKIASESSNWRKM